MDLQTVLRWVAYILLIASAIPLGMFIRQFIKSRRAPYYALRRSALQAATRRLLLVAIMLALAFVLLIVCPILNARTSEPTETPPPARTPGTPTATSESDTPPQPTHAPTVAPTQRPTATGRPAPPPTTAPPAPTLDAGPTPELSPVPAQPDARVEFTALAMEKDDNGLPVNAATEFPPGDHAVYVFFTYEGMQNGVERTFAWYKDGEYFERCSQTALWNWGSRGRTSYFCHPSEGWEPGRYEVQVFVEDKQQFVVEFVIAE